MATAQTKSVGSWARALEQNLQYRGDIVPEGWQTCRQIAAELGRAENTVVRHIGDLIRAGKAETKRFRVPSGAAVKSIQHYKLK